MTTQQDLPLVANLRRLFILRNIAIPGELLVIYGAFYGLEMHLPLLVMTAVVGFHLAVNVYTWARLRRGGPMEAAEFFIQLLLDVLVLALLLYWSGGSTNPFVSLLLLPLIVVAAILPRPYVLAMAVLTVMIYSIQMFYFHPLPHAHHRFGEAFNLHVLGMWFGFLLSVALIVFFVVKLAQSLRERDRKLALAREQALRDEQLVALGTLAAGAAHELGTPLSTMTVVVGEMEHDFGSDPDLGARVKLLSQQLKRCKETLSVISVSAGQAKADSGYRARLDDYLNDTLEQWQHMRPDAELVCRWLSDKGDAPEIVADQGLAQAIINILNNAADESKQAVEVEGRWNGTLLELNVLDRGAGVSDEMRRMLGREPVTSTKEGQGVGLFLACAVIRRLGGKAAFYDREGGGARIEVRLPLDKLLVQV